MSEIRIQDDLYQAVNGEWLKNATIPADRSTAGGFAELDQGVEKKLMNDFKELEHGEMKTDISQMNEAIKLYRVFLNAEKRNSEGIKPILPLLNEIKNIKTIDDLNKKASELVLQNVDLPINFGVEPDMKDATKHSFVITGPSIILPDVTYYDENNKAGKKLLEVYSSMVRILLSYTDLSNEEKEEYIKDTLSFDALVAKKVKSQLEWADYVNNYNPITLEEVIECVKPFDFKGMLSSFYKDSLPKEVIAYDLKAIKEFSFYFNKETFTSYIHWAYVKALVSFGYTLSEGISEISNTYTRTLRGIEKDPVLEKQAYQCVSRLFSEPIGVYYGRKYFGEEAKKDVVSLVKKIIETYK